MAVITSREFSSMDKPIPNRTNANYFGFIRSIRCQQHWGVRARLTEGDPSSGKIPGGIRRIHVLWSP